MASFTKGYFNAPVDIPGGESLVLNGSTTGNVNVTANASTTSYEAVLPDAIGTADQVLAISSISSTKAVLAWTDVTALSLAADDISIGDAAVNITTSTGGINIGTNSVAMTHTIGNITGNTAVNINAGTGGCALFSTGIIDLDCTGIMSLNSSAAAINIGNDVVAQAINIGSGAAARAIQVGNAASTSVDIDALAVTLTSVNALQLTDGTATLTLGGTGATSLAAATTVDLDCTGIMSLNSSAAAINIGNDDIDQDINIGTQGERSISIGTGAFADVITIGNVTSTTSVNINSGTGGITLSGKIINGTETVTESTVSSTISASPTQIAVTKSITLFDIGTANDYYASVTSASPTDGQLWNIMYDDTGFTGASLRIDFSSSGLVAGSGYAQYLTFNDVGQSASLVYVGSKWRIINTGASVS